jgi:hypothetical protein
MSTENFIRLTNCGNEFVQHFLIKLIFQICRSLNVLLLVKLQFYYYSNVSIAEILERWKSILKYNPNIYKKVTVYSGGFGVLNFVFHFTSISSG